MNNCIDCNTVLSRGAKSRCVACYRKFVTTNKDYRIKQGQLIRMAMRGQGDRKNKMSDCIDCGNKTCSATAKRCMTCYLKFNKEHPESNSQFGKEITEETREKKSRSHLGVGWLDIIKEYPEEFDDNLKVKIRKRDDYECRNCGMAEKEHLIVMGQVLHIHHIDYNKENCNNQNLITICKQCHAKTRYNRDYWTTHYQTLMIQQLIHNVKGNDSEVQLNKQTSQVW